MARSAKLRKRKPAPQRSTLPRYVVKLHEDDFLMKNEDEVLRFDNFDDAVECCADLNIPLFVDADYCSRIITLDSFLVT
ncbi:TPA: transposase [Escherichia coli]|nr:transposase [Escherichia coli]